MKGPRGYGFSVSTETSPVMITDVQEGKGTSVIFFAVLIHLIFQVSLLISKTLELEILSLK